MERKYAWNKYVTAEDRTKVMEYAEGYRQFLSECKTERECTSWFVKEAEKAGFRNLDDVIAAGERLSAGDRVYRTNQGKMMALFVVGSEPVEQGMNILGAHIDSPRIDLKQVPLTEDVLYRSHFAMLDTHYYGGVKKYQWVTLPLAIHGVVAKKDGSVVSVCIGEDPADPVFGISDLLIHLSADQLKKTGDRVVEGEDLNILFGTIPLPEEEEPDAKTRVKANVLRILEETYGIGEEDFISAELEVVPAGAARDYGIDRSLVMGYGHDDRVCAYPSFKAIVEAPAAKRTLACLLVDKEEIGSVGATGMQSRFFENTVAELISLCGSGSDLALRRAMANSMALSSDVSAGMDPNYPTVMEPENAAYLGKGLVFNKYTGARGKSGSNDASAEYMGRLRALFDGADVSWQTAELGKVDQGGGGTIAYILGNYGMNVIDSGVAVLNMHAPWELISKVDLYEAMRGYVAFLGLE